MHASVGIVSMDRCPHFGQVSSHCVIMMRHGTADGELRDRPRPKYPTT